MGEIKNAKIERVSFGYEDHGILTFWLDLNLGDMFRCSFGGYALDEYDKQQGKRVADPKALDCLTQIMKTVGVDKWEDLTGKYIRCIDNGLGKSINVIGNIMEDKWFDIKDFYGEKKLWNVIEDEESEAPHNKKEV